MGTDMKMRAIVYAIAKCRAENKVILGYLIGSIGENYPGFSAFLQRKITKEIADETTLQMQQMVSVLDMYDQQEKAEEAQTKGGFPDMSIEQLLRLFTGK